MAGEGVEPSSLLLHLVLLSLKHYPSPLTMDCHTPGYYDLWL